MDGRHHLTTWIPDNIDRKPGDFSKLMDIAEEKFLEDLIEVIENCLLLKKSNQSTGFIQTLKLYETPEGDLVEIANDDFQGIMVESENAEIINKIYERLLKI
ncbi:hypothetical protein BDW_12320 [Bdellovibrio bacteriovorus W]|nr:hypothetical protein BDW_12320 [Bdellovibrio bacteriovorus W]